MLQYTSLQLPMEQHLQRSENSDTLLMNGTVNNETWQNFFLMEENVMLFYYKQTDNLTALALSLVSAILSNSK